MHAPDAARPRHPAWRTPATAACAIALVLLAALIVAWHAWLSPPEKIPVWLALVPHVFILVPPLVMLLRRDPRFAFWAALGALLLFCHGVMEAWSAPAMRALALAESALCVIIIAGASLDGLRARFARKPGV